MDGWKRWLWLRLERALYAVLPMDEWEQDTVNIDKAKLQCPICTQPLKPPIFQCVAGHLACGACHGQFPNKDRCYKCAHPGGYSCSFPLEDVIRSTSAKIYCPECLHAPCRCSEPGCAFVGSPVWLPPKSHAFLARKQHRLWRGMPTPVAGVKAAVPAGGEGGHACVRRVRGGARRRLAGMPEADCHGRAALHVQDVGDRDRGRGDRQGVDRLGGDGGAEQRGGRGGRSHRDGWRARGCCISCAEQDAGRAIHGAAPQRYNRQGADMNATNHASCW